MKIRISNRQKKFRIVKNSIESLCRDVLLGEGQPDDVEIDISIVGSREIARLNTQYLDHEGRTDVISFPQQSQDALNALLPGSVLLGDVVVCAQEAYEQSKQYKNSFNQEFGLYIIHGILHLLGFDDQKPDQKKVMELHQTRWFNTLLKSDKPVLILENNNMNKN